MADPEPQIKPQVSVDPLPQEQGAAQRQRMQTYAAADQPRPGIPGGEGGNPVRYRQPPKPAGPQLWAVVITIGGLYYLWTRVLGKPLPSFAQRGHRIGAKAKTTGGGGVSNNNRQAEIQAARERQQQRLETAARAREMVNQANKDRNLRERTNATSSGNGSSAAPSSSSSGGGLSINQQAALLKAQQAQKQKQAELEQKKKKQRQLYLKQKALKEKEEEKRKKDQELGPGWEFRQDPNAATALNHMDPQAGASGGGYKAAKKCAPRGGG